MIDKVRKYIDQWKMLQNGDRVIVGVSGGADSVCLLFVLQELREKMDLELIVVHVNHQIRGDAAVKDEMFTKELCESLEICYKGYHRDIPALAREHRKSEEEMGRDVRQEIFREVLENYNGTKIALAHHANDNAETLLLNLARGTGLRGLGGIKPVNQQVIRPLLCLSRREIESFLKERGITYCEDETNSSDLYMRNKIRNHVIPYLEENVNKKTVSHMNNTLAQLQLVHEYVEEQAEVWKCQCVQKKGTESILDKEGFEKAPFALQSIIVRKVIEEQAKRQKDISQKHISAACELLELQVGRSIHLPYNIKVFRCYEGLRFTREEPNAKQVSEVSLPFNAEIEVDGLVLRTKIWKPTELANEGSEKHYTKQFDYGIIKSNVSIRTRQPGDYIVIDKQGSRQKLKAFFINNKVRKEDRDHILLIASGSHVLWIIGMRQSEACRVEAYTEEILEIQIEKPMEDNNGRNN